MARKILLADDSVTAQNMGRKILADAGYEVITVNNGSAALKKIAEAKPDLIVLDVYMPGYSGLEVCQRLKESQETARLPVLLTVGKLEPFKPEEAKRVRAEGFIVKPFEASELLSALAKLEDKIVPRAEASKPGRFARANAALDEGRYDKSVAIDEDSGWKNRISFPHKKESSAEADSANNGGDEAKSAPVREAKPQQPERVNLAALSTDGLPKDVTPEEIAALAAAAAQVKGKIAEFDVAASPVVPPTVTPAVVNEAPREETKFADAVPAEVQHESNSAADVANVAAAATTFAGQREDHLNLHEPREEKPEEAAFSQPENSEKSVEEKHEAPAAKPSVADQNAPTFTSEAVAELGATEAAAHAGLELISGNGSGAYASNVAADEPVTMAVAAGAEGFSKSSRWTAVSVALDAEDGALSLEDEMQKAYAASAAPETAHAESSAVVSEAHAAVVEPSPSARTSPAESPVLDSHEVPAQEAPAPEVTEAVHAVAVEATDAISAAVKELEAVAASYTDLHARASTESLPDPVKESAVSQNFSAASPVEAKPAELEAVQEVAAIAAPAHEDVKAREQSAEELRSEQFKTESAEPQFAEAKSEESEPAPASMHASSEPEVTAPTSTAVPAEPTKDSDIAATTAAAWASWRQIRETGTHASDPAAQDSSAMAVAAGAERTPTEADESNPEDIAGIVDSVLADLRPKIFEEISRKMGKKK